MGTNTQKTNALVKELIKKGYKTLCIARRERITPQNETYRYAVMKMEPYDITRTAPWDQFDFYDLSKDSSKDKIDNAISKGETFYRLRINTTALKFLHLVELLGFEHIVKVREGDSAGMTLAKEIDYATVRKLGLQIHSFSSVEIAEMIQVFLESHLISYETIWIWARLLRDGYEYLDYDGGVWKPWGSYPGGELSLNDFRSIDLIEQSLQGKIVLQIPSNPFHLDFMEEVPLCSYNPA